MTISVRYFCALSLGLVAFAAQGRERTEAELCEAARGVLMSRSVHHAPAVEKQLVTFEKNEATSILGYQDGGFVVMANDDILPAVLGYSDSSFANGGNPNFQWWKETMEAACRDRIARNMPYTVVAPDPSLYEESMDALVSARWGQEAPYWNWCPNGTTSESGWGYEGGNGRCVTGCVATGMAQVLYFHKAPAVGQGTHSVQVRQSDGSYITVSVNYEDCEYDWDNMLDEYHYGQYSDEEADAVAELMLSCGVAADMNYATDGSGTYMRNCTDGLRRNFGFADVQLWNRYDYSEDQWMEMVYTELNEFRPIVYGGADMSLWAGHCFVIDGYDTRGFVHVNWGWDGSSDGYYDIALLNPGSYTFSGQQEAVIGVHGDSVTVVRRDTLQVTAPGTLNTLINDELVNECTRMIVEGTINADDISAIRNLSLNGKLRTLDMRGSTIVEGEVMDNAFAGCNKLSKIVLPRGLKRIGSKAFDGCSRLYELRVYDREIPKLGSKVFNGVNQSSCHLYVPAATREKYERAAQWKNFGTTKGNIAEFGTAFTVRNLVKEEGQPMPDLRYTMVGASVEGEPELTCEANENSPVGRYPIHISRGTVLNQDVDFEDGFLIITESTAGIEAVQADAADGERNEIYNLHGQLVRSNAVSTEGLPAGVYLMKGQRIVVR